MRILTLLAVLALAPLLAGCTNDANGQSASGEGSLAYNGASSGSHSDSFECGSSAQLHVNANMGSGSLTVTVKDETGATLKTKSYSSVGQVSESMDVSGTSGMWTVTATRGSGFTGQYAVHVQC